MPSPVTYPDPFAEFPQFQFQPFRSSATRRLRIPWSDILTELANTFPPTLVSGTTIQVGAGSAMPGFPWLFATSMSVQPMTNRMVGTDASGEIVYDEADVTITYQSPPAPQDPADTDGDPVPQLQHRWAIGGHTFTVDGAKLQWAGDEQPASATTPVSKTVPRIEHQITWPRLLRPPLTAIRELLGNINDAATSFATLTIPVECLLFLGAELTRDIMSDGTRAWTLTYRFSEQTIVGPSDVVFDPVDTLNGENVGGWNHFYYHDDGARGFFRLRHLNTGLAGDVNYNQATAIFIKGDMNKLFQPEPL